MRAPHHAMELRNSFTVPADLETAWHILLDVPRIAPCMPGAELTEAVDDRHFKGNAKVRVGPVQLTFAGEAEITDIDEAAHTARVAARGNDTKGRGAAQADVTFTLHEEAGHTRVDIATDLALTGSVAQYGRASGLIDAVAGQIIADFARNLERELGSAPAPSVATEPAPGEVAGARPAAPQGGGAPAAGAREERDNAISGVRLVLRALWSMLRGWFGAGR